MVKLKEKQKIKRIFKILAFMMTFSKKNIEKVIAIKK